MCDEVALLIALPTRDGACGGDLSDETRDMEKGMWLIDADEMVILTTYRIWSLTSIFCLAIIYVCHSSGL